MIYLHVHSNYFHLNRYNSFWNNVESFELSATKISALVLIDTSSPQNLMQLLAPTNNSSRNLARSFNNLLPPHRSQPVMTIQIAICIVSKQVNINLDQISMVHPIDLAMAAYLMLALVNFSHPLT